MLGRSMLTVPMCLAVITVSTLCSPAHGADSAGQSGSWLFGFGIGWGVATIDAPVQKEDGAGAMGNARLAFPMGNRFMAGFEGTSWWSSTMLVSATTISVWYFPRGQGLSLRAGAGFGSVDEGKTSVTTSHSGAGFTAGAAFELSTGRSFTLGPQFTYGYVSTDSIDSNHWGLELAINWRSPGR